LSFPLVGNPSDSPLWKRGVRGDFIGNRFIQKIPLTSPFAKGGRYEERFRAIRNGKIEIEMLK
jgi:hypothetical protein